MRVLLPINLDRASSPISSLLREIAFRARDFEFHSFVSPRTAEDQTNVEKLRALPNVYLGNPSAVLTRRFDVVHHASCTPRNKLLIQLARIRANGRCRHLFTANVQPHAEDPYHRDYVWSAARASEIVAVSQAVADDLKSQFGRTPLAIIPNGFDDRYFDPAVISAEPPGTKDWGFARRPFFLFVAALEARKRPDFFVRLAQRFSKAHFVMAGSTMDDWSDKVLAQGELLPNFSYLGQCSREEIRFLLNHTIALIFPSRREGLPLTVIEAMGMGRRVVATPESSLPELIRTELEGKLIPISREDDWLTALEGELDRVSKTPRETLLAERARLRSQTIERFSWSKVARDYACVYREMLTPTTQ